MNSRINIIKDIPWRQFVLMLVSSLLLTTYFIPNTAVSKLSPLYYLDLTYTGFTNLWQALSALLIFSVSCAVTYRRINTTAQRWLLLTFAGYVALYFVELFCTFNDRAIALSCSFTIMPCLVGIVVALFCGDTLSILYVLCMAAFLQCCYSLILYIHGQGGMVSGSINRAGGTFADPNSLEFLICMSLPICTSLAMATRNLLFSSSYTVAFAVMLGTLYSTQSRGGVIAAAIGLSWLIYRILGAFRSATIILILVAMAGVCVYSRSSGDINAKSVARSNLSRATLAKQSLKIFEGSWLTGVGVAHLEVPVTVLYKGVFIKTTIPEPKNVALYLLDQLGVGGGILFLVVGLLVHRTLRNDQRIEGWTLKSMWLVFFISGISDTPFGTITRASGSALLAILISSTALHKSLPDSSLD